MSDNKYKDFRNYMTNELGITRQDIEAWTKQSVANEVNKLVGQMNIEEKVRQAINSVAHTAINNSSYRTGNELRQAVALELCKNLKVTLEGKS